MPNISMMEKSIKLLIIIKIKPLALFLHSYGSCIGKEMKQHVNSNDAINRVAAYEQ
jgi:hypothetical protein